VEAFEREDEKRFERRVESSEHVPKEMDMEARPAAVKGEPK
jgi:hypothetical protein